MSYIFQPARFELERQIEKYADSVQGRMLDVGSGSRPRYRGLFKNITDYVKLDIEGVPDIDVIGSVEAIPLPNESFDSIISTQVIGDVFLLEKAFTEFSRVLKPGGVLLLTEAFMDPHHDEPYDYWRFTPHSLKRLAENAGFNIVAIDRRGGFRTVQMQFRLRYMIERFQIYRRWYRKFFSMAARLYGRYALWRDAQDKSEANKLFAHGYLLLARKKG